MCVVCGCASPAEATQARHDHAHDHDHAHGHDHHHHHDRHHAPAVTDQGTLHYGVGSARVSVPGMSQARAIKLEADVLGENNRIAAANRAHFAAHGVTAYNLVSSPGSGKTTLLCATIAALRERAHEAPEPQTEAPLHQVLELRIRHRQHRLDLGIGHGQHQRTAPALHRQQREHAQREVSGQEPGATHQAAR